MNQCIRVAFRVDSSQQMGSGHLMRCLTLANELKRRGAEILFISREHPGHLITRLKEASYSICHLPAPPEPEVCAPDDYAAWLGVTIEQDAAETLAALNGQTYDWLVVDHYGLDIHWEQRVRAAVGQILVIDDLANRRHDCDVLLDQNYYGATTEARYKRWMPTDCKGLFGPRYALLQPEYTTLSHLFLPRDGHIYRVFVFFGASDLDNQTGKLLEVLSHPDLDHLVVDVVMGANHPNPEGIVAMVDKRPRTTLHQHLPSIAALMVRADLFIGAGGATTWERMALGLPSLVISVAENQQEFSRVLALEGFQFTLPSGSTASSSEWHEAINLLVKKPGIVHPVAQKSKKLVDGFGTNRVASILIGLNAFSLKLRRACQADESLLLQWVNDPDVRKQSFHQDVVREHEHAQWFSEKLKESDCIIFIAEDERALPVGQVRFEVNRKRAEAFIDISLDRSLRGQKLSEKLLSQALNQWMALEPDVRLFAEVRDENRASQRLFTKLQFIPIPSTRNGSTKFELINQRNNEIT